MEKLINQIVKEEAGSATKSVQWPDEYVNRKTGDKFRMPSNPEVHKVLETHQPKYVLFAGPEGSGKTSLGSRFCLDKLKMGCDGALICPDFPYLKKIVRTFLEWVPRQVVIQKDRRYLDIGHEPYQSSYSMTFHNELGGHSTLLIMGAGGDYKKLESVNLNFIWFEEARSVRDSQIMDVITGRIRIKGPSPYNTPPQLYITTTPTEKSHWLYSMWGPELPEHEDDPYRLFKRKAKVVKLSLEDNLDHLADDYVEDRVIALTENEKRMRIDGEWGEEESESPFLPSMDLWTKLYDPSLKPVRKKDDPDRDFSDLLVLGVDGSTKHDAFSIVGVTRHPDNREEVAVRLVKTWHPRGEYLDFTEQEEYIRELNENFVLLICVYDKYQLHQMMKNNLGKEMWTREFSQQTGRTISDQQLFTAIMQQKVHHMGQKELEQHIRSADAKMDEDGHRRRLIKRNPGSFIDSAVALSMAHHECLRLSI